MKKKIVALVLAMSMSVMLLSGCQAKELSNKYATVKSYKGVEVDKVDKPEVSDDDVDNQIQSAMVENITDITEQRAAQNGDKAIIDFVGKKDGVAFQKGSSTDYTLELGSGTFINGFEDGIIGHAPGETFDLNLTFPENYQSTELAGQEVVFTVTLKGFLPELSDDIVTVLSDKSKTVEEYKKEVKDKLQETADESYQSSLREAAWNAVLENTEVKEYPEDKVQEYVDMMQEQYETMATYYNMEFEDFLTTYMQMDKDSFDEKVKEAAEQQVKSDLARDLLLDNVKKIDTSDEARQKIYEALAESYNYDDVDSFLEAMENADNMDKLDALVKLEMVQNWVADNCKQVEAKSDSSSSDSSSSSQSE